MEAKKESDSMFSEWMKAFNRVSLVSGMEMDCWMADVAAEIVLMSDDICGKDRSFFDKGLILLSECNEATRDNIKACMFWWIFNGSVVDASVEGLLEDVDKKWTRR